MQNRLFFRTRCAKLESQNNNPLIVSIKKQSNIVPNNQEQRMSLYFERMAESADTEPEISACSEVED
ncbi:hypothetical protein HRI_000314700 [Hibiscus trionum]|uniref:Uncharacterized protein n=1 Tax=Hibiscus trionum TaxID=183268 RepID=A0A9W7LJG1_HIBTR|nr:hypothetical protein HRI_000314700 [Hibiscus trionum]